MANTSARIYVQRDKHPDFQQLSQGVDAPFEQLTDVFVAAAAVGYRNGVKSPTVGASQHVGFWHSLKNDTDIPLLQAIAIAETDDIEVLSDSQRVLDIAQDYANAGIVLLVEKMGAEFEDSVVALSLEALKNLQPE